MPRVQYHTSLRRVTGKREEVLPARTVKELLGHLSDCYGGRLDGYLRSSTVIVNGKNVIHMKGKRTRLEPDDVVSIFPPMAGG